eukprot:TRINITY_DN3199_c0_g1_i3.p1 TRINITY_DN3199_c0_g1~~TRINITY_DN3199_c0_g1_i3.p1  ORF type:complete len:1054 (+),score=209.18 TRINITY_DN3199_c0_g1_i3:1232-4393(+)
MAGRLQLTQEKLLHLVDVYCYEVGGSINKLVEALEKDQEESVLMSKGEEQMLEGFKQYVESLGEEGREPGLGVADPDGYERCSEVPRCKPHDVVTYVKVLEELNCLVTSTASGRVAFLSLDTFSTVFPFPESLTLLAAECIKIPTAINLLLATSFSTLHIYELFLNKLKPRKAFVTPLPVHTLCHHPFCDKVFTGGRDGVVSAFPYQSLLKTRTSSMQLISVPHVKLKLFASNITSMAVHSRLIIITSLQGGLVFYDTLRECVTQSVSTEAGIKVLRLNTAAMSLVSIGTASTNPTAWALDYPKHSHTIGPTSLRGAILVDLVSLPSTPEVLTIDTNGDMKVWCLVGLCVTHVLTSDKSITMSPACVLYLPSRCQMIGFGKTLNSWRATHSTVKQVHYETVRGMEWLQGNGPVRLTTYTANEMKAWNSCYGQVAVPLIREFVGCITCSAGCGDKMVVGTTKGEVAHIDNMLQTLHVCIPRSGAISQLAYCTGQRLVIGYESGWVLVMCDKQDTEMTWWEVRVFQEEISAMSAVEGGTLTAFCTHLGTVVVADVLAKHFVARYDVGRTEVNAIVWLCEGLMCIVTGKGRIQLWCSTQQDDECFAVLCERKHTNPDYQHKKGVAKGLRYAETDRYSLKRPVCCQATFTSLSFLVTADDQGWVTVYDCFKLLDAYNTAGYRGMYHFTSMPVVHQWQAHTDEVAACLCTPYHIVTSGLLDKRVIVWSFSGKEVHQLSKGSAHREVGQTKAERCDFDIPPYVLVHRSRMPVLPKGKSLMFIRKGAERDHEETGSKRAGSGAKAHSAADSPPAEQKPRVDPLEVMQQSIPVSECSVRGAMWDSLAERQFAPKPPKQPPVQLRAHRRMTLQSTGPHAPDLSPTLRHRKLSVPKLPTRPPKQEDNLFKHKSALLMSMLYKQRDASLRRDVGRTIMKIPKADFSDTVLDVLDSHRERALDEGEFRSKSLREVFAEIAENDKKEKMKAAVARFRQARSPRLKLPAPGQAADKKPTISSPTSTSQFTCGPSMFYSSNDADTSSTPRTPDETFFVNERRFSSYFY